MGGFLPGAALLFDFPQYLVNLRQDERPGKLIGEGELVPFFIEGLNVNVQPAQVFGDAGAEGVFLKVTQDLVHVRRPGLRLPEHAQPLNDDAFVL